MSRQCDVLIIGAGPAGLSAAAELLSRSSARVVILEKGPALDRRTCPALTHQVCPSCSSCDLLFGVGGASGIVGGKICFFPAGQRLADHTGYTSHEANRRLMRFFESIGFGHPASVITNPISGGVETLGKELTHKSYDAIPILRPTLQALFRGLVDSVVDRGAVLVPEAGVERVAAGKGTNRFEVSYRAQGLPYRLGVSQAIVLATGRGTTRWLGGLLNDVGVATGPTTVDVGVRIEIPRAHSNGIFDEEEDPKIRLRAGTDEEVRTLCWCRGGEMSVTNIDGYPLVDGHFGDRWKPFTSVSLVARTPVPTGRLPFDHAIDLFYGTSSQKRRMGPFQQTLHEFMATRARYIPQSTLPPLPYRCREQDLARSVSPELVRQVSELIESLDDLGDGCILRSPIGRVYGPVVDNLWFAPRLDRNLMTAVDGLYLAGDITGLGRGIAQAIFSGIIAGQDIVADQQSQTYEPRNLTSSLSAEIRRRGQPAELLGV